MTELERYKKALAHAEANLRSIASYTGTFAEQANNALQRINAYLSPEPEWEEVEVVRWVCMDCGTSEPEKFDICVDGCVSNQIVKLTGTYRKEKPRPVERSVSVEVMLDDDGSPWVGGKWQDYGSTVDCFPRQAGKTGTLTFAWTEDAK